MHLALPLSGVTFVAGEWPAAQVAAELLSSLGAQLSHRKQRLPTDIALSTGSTRVTAEPSSLKEDLTASRIMDLTGRRDGPCLVPWNRAATVARAAGIAMRLFSNGGDQNTIQLLAQRAKLLGLSRNGSKSAGGAARLIRSRDGWFALNLPRASDTEMLPALLEAQPSDDPWHSIEEWASIRPMNTIFERATLLDLAIGPLPTVRRMRPAKPWKITAFPALGRLRQPVRVLNLGALWAGPLCAQLLRQSGMQVFDLQSVERPELGPKPFYDVLHEGHTTIKCDFRTSHGRAKLASLLHDADVVIEASRPRALCDLGVPAEVIMQDRRPRVWVHITGHGRHNNRVAFGDDAAVAGGLVAWDDNGPVFVGDAIADPLTGMLAALAVKSCVSAGGSWIIDISMVAVASFANGSSID